MPDLMKTPSNRRYVVNFQNKEPNNKYDIWLSFNKHDEGGKVVMDSEYLAEKDLVFKVYINGKWKPILGIPVSYEGIVGALEELDRKKINVVPSFTDGHIAVFHHGTDDCDQLIDGGTIEQLLTTILLGGGTIPLQRATTSVLGGIRASMHNNNEDAYVEAKFKGPEGPTDNDRLYVSASEIVTAINNLPGGSDLHINLMGPDNVGGAEADYVPVDSDLTEFIPVLVSQSTEHMYISGETVLSVLGNLLGSGSLSSLYTAGEGIDITDGVISNTVADDNERGGIRAEVFSAPSDEAAFKPVQVKFLNKTNPNLPSYEKLYVDAAEIVHQLADILTSNDIFIGDKGITITPDYAADTITWTLTGADNSINYNKYLYLDANGNVKWEIVGGVQTYPSLTDTTPGGTQCVVVAPSKKEGFLCWDGTFQPVPNSVYHSGVGIYVNSSNYINIDARNIAQGKVLAADGHNGVEWVTHRTYTAGNGIEISNSTIGSTISRNTTSYTIDNTTVPILTFNINQNVEGVKVNVVNPGRTLYPFSYTEITYDVTGDAEISFDLSSQLNVMEGKPVYVKLTIAGNSVDSVEITVSDGKLIQVDDVVFKSNDTPYLNIRITKEFLLTLQFGIVKIEPIGYYPTN